MDGYCAGVWIDDPIFPYACFLIKVELYQAVNAAGGIRKNFNYQIRGASDTVPVDFVPITNNH